jgi:lipopolysaccharide export LptBFGC system permease protein LptF
LTGAVLVLALVGSCVSLVATAWAIPAAGQAYRVSVARKINATTGAQASLTKGTKGAVELTLGELNEQMNLYVRDGGTKRARRLAHAYHLRWSLPCATFALALFALSAMPRRPVGRLVLSVAAVATCLAYYAVLLAGEVLGQQGTLPAYAATWLPNTVFAGGSAALLILGTHGSSPIRDEG